MFLSTATVDGRLIFLSSWAPMGLYGGHSGGGQGIRSGRTDTPEAEARDEPIGKTGKTAAFDDTGIKAFTAGAAAVLSRAVVRLFCRGADLRRRSLETCATGQEYVDKFESDSSVVVEVRSPTGVNELALHEEALPRGESELDNRTLNEVAPDAICGASNRGESVADVTEAAESDPFIEKASDG